MYTFTVFTPFAFLAVKVCGAPVRAQDVEARQLEARITLMGFDPNANFPMSFPANNQPVTNKS